jgi:UDP-glucuronate 4-epimerase
VKVLVTGAAGFIGFHTARRLLERGEEVVGFDVVNDYYDPTLKEARLAVLREVEEASLGAFAFVRADIADKAAVEGCFGEHDFDRVIHLAGQAGVRYSLENPDAYVEANLVGFTHILEACRSHGLPPLTYASTSSVYGANTAMPFSEHDGVNHPLQFYAATKRANELMAHAYSHLFRLPTTGLRFFTVYGPWGRPDMAFFKFTRHIIEGRPIPVFNNGHHSRAFTYVDDIVDGVVRACDQPANADPDWDAAAPDPATSDAPFRIYNLGGESPMALGDYIAEIERAVGKTAIKEYLPMQPGDVLDSTADIALASRALGYSPKVGVAEGIAAFVAWYRNYYDV